jgi:lycopene beta-cyclase
MPVHYTNIYKTALEPTKRVDLAIIGGGCAGLSLARELAARQILDSVVILEPRTQYVDDRSWCFWLTPHHALAHLVSHTWSSWTFGKKGEQFKTRGSTNNPYQYIRSADFYRDCLDGISESPSIELKLGCTVTTITRQNDAWHIETDQESFLAKQVIDTRPPSPEHLSQANLYQCF